MSTGNRDKYKPVLPTDAGYIKRVAKSINKKEKQENVNFGLLNEVLLLLGITKNPYSCVGEKGFDTSVIDSIVEDSYNLINSIKISPEIREKLLELWDYLVESDPIEKSDLIFVFGGGSTTRPILAAKMYKEGWAPKVLFTGRHASYMKDEQKSEAELFADVAMENGVLEEDIILETESKNTPENVINSIKILKEREELPGKIILTQIEYQMRRAYLTFKAVADWNPKLIRRPAPSAKFKRENYWTNKIAWTYVFLEYIKMYGARQMGHF